MNPNGMSLLWTLLPGALLVLGAVFAWRGGRLLRRVWANREHPDSPLWLLRGGRGLIVAISCACMAYGLAYDFRGLLWFGLAFLGEEIYETGVALLILRHGRGLAQLHRAGIAA